MSQDSVRKVLDRLVGEAQHAEALAAQPGVTLQIMQAVFVVRAVGLDDQAVTQTDEVRHLAADRQLAAKLQAVEAAIMQELPQQALGRGRFATQRPCEGEVLGAIDHSKNNT